jgi:hypothetical protein
MMRWRGRRCGVELFWSQTMKEKGSNEFVTSWSFSERK